jgi:hypothetical protein
MLNQLSFGYNKEYWEGNMTAQISDTFIYKGDAYSLIGIVGEGLVKPEDFGMTPQMLITCCWRGFFSTYEITDESIFLKEMTINEKNGNYKPINDVMPANDENGMFYKDVNFPLLFLGKIRLAKDFIMERYVHQGFQKSSAFETVIDLRFENGRIVEIQDRSSEVEAIRKNDGGRRKKRGLFKSIKKAYSLDMDLE